jgi:hypothetical protein
MATAAEPVYRQWFRGWNSYDITKILASLTDDAVYEDVPTGTVNRTYKEARPFIEAA